MITDKELAELILSDLEVDKNNKLNSFNHERNKKGQKTIVKDSLFFKSKTSNFSFNFMIDTQELNYKIFTIKRNNNGVLSVDQNLFLILNVFDELFGALLKQDITINNGHNVNKLIQYDLNIREAIVSNLKNRAFFHPKISYQRFLDVVINKCEPTYDEDAYLNQWDADGVKRQILMANPFIEYVDKVRRDYVIMNTL